MVSRRRDWAARDDSYRYQGLRLERNSFRFEQGLSESFVVGDRPVGVNANHHRVSSISALDGERRPRERGGSAGWLRLRDDVFLWKLWQQLANRVGQTGIREDDSVLRIHDRPQPGHGVVEQRLLRHKRKKLLGLLRCAERPESRTCTTRQNHSPAAHSPIIPASSGAPVRRATSA